VQVLVTGAAGQLGAYVVRELARRDFGVRALVEPGGSTEALEGTGVESVEGDVTVLPHLRRALEGCQAVIHAASMVSLWPPHSVRTTRVNVGGTLNMIEAALEARVKRFVYVGSASSFGPGTLEHPADERSPCRSSRYRTSYMDSKRRAHEIVLEAIRERGLPAVVVNPTYLIGAYGRPDGSSGALLRLRDGGLRAIPSGGRNLVYAGDAAVGACNALHEGRIGECYILGHANLTYRQAADLLSRVLHRPVTARTARPLAVRLAGLAGSLSGALTRRAPALSFPVARMLCVEWYHSPRKAVRELGLPQTPLDRAMREALAWFSREGCPWP